MARSLNRAILIGNLGADPEVRSTANGARVAQFSLATGRSWTDARGEARERTEWHRVVVWGGLVDVVESYLKKGGRVYVEGEIQYRSYEDGEGTTRYVTEINARELLLLGGRPDEEAGAAEDMAREDAARKEKEERRRGRETAGAGSRSRGRKAALADDLPF